MNTKTISPFASIQYNLWKDFRQILTVILAVIGGVTLIQLTFLAARFLVDRPMNWTGLTETTLIQAGIGSLLTIIGSAAMMIGHERQTGTWGWASSLPASWAQTLASKLIVSFASSVLTGGALCCIPLVVYVLRRSDIPFSLAASNYFLIASAAILLQTWAFFFLATLFFKDTMTGMVCASVVCVLVQMLIGVWMIEYQATNGTLIELQALVSLFAFLGMIGTYRWRWRLGQNSEFSLRRENLSYVVPAKCVYVVSQPSEWRMLLSLSAQNMFVFRVLLAVSSTLFLAWLSWPDPDIKVTTGFVLAVMSLGFGLTAFMGDQANGRFRFLADRGVHPIAMVTSRLAVPGCWLFFCLFIAVVLNAVLGFFRPIGALTYWNDLSVELFFVWSLITCCCFSVGALASLCFRQPIIACFSAGVVSIMTAVLYGVMADSIHGDWNLFWIWMNALIWMTFVPFLLLFVTYRFARKWIVSDRLSLFTGFTAICGLSMFFPFFLSATFSFWMVPTIPNAEKLMAESDFDTESLPPLGPVLDALVLNLEPYPEESLANHRSRIAEQAMAGLDKAREAFSQPKVTKQLESDELLLMNQLILQSAELANKLAQRGCLEESSKAWKLCGTFQQHCGPRLALLTTASRNSVGNLAKQMVPWHAELLERSVYFSDNYSIHDATKWMRAKAEVDALRGIQHDSPTAIKSSVTRPLLAIYPPIRWRLEREAIQNAMSTGATNRVYSRR